jgi:plastocyanin
VYVAWYDHVNQNLERGTYADVSGLALVKPSPTSTAGPTGSPTSAPPTAACDPKGTKLKISAPVGAGATGFSIDCLAAPADTPFTIEFDNQDTGVPHNVAAYIDFSAATSLFAGEIITAPDTIVYEVDPQPAGEYFFRCDVHPTTMTGTLIIK